MPEIDGREYMNPAYGHGMEKARKDSEEKDSRGEATRIEFEKAEDGSFISRTHRKAKKDKDDKEVYRDPETRTHDSSSDAAAHMQNEWQ